ncbi:hypothetical protein EKE94_07750 [Mesobaculum littorinae]|uniref:Mth938-like domain-containing protein n=1 Tax=Mesobaculum littorinae TaxID=2486419 RepID=A0A438AJK1_9RHOB|nr:Mth938-like domain-containing protein [Mesobaculum littorinae]RVV98785.1 hypothetical protein EKE94_07750 [Mesobaculum littorinae]
MRLNEITYTDARPVDGYGPGFFRVGGEVMQGGVLLLPDGLRPWAGYAALDPVLGAAGKVDFLFIGTGAEPAYLPRDFREALEAAEIGVESMATPAACRTYNVLLSEGRRVGAALLAV